MVRKQECLWKYFKAGQKVKKIEMAHTEMTEDVQYDFKKLQVKRWRKGQMIKNSRHSFVKVAWTLRGTYSKGLSKYALFLYS